MESMDLLSALALIKRYGFDNVEIWANPCISIRLRIRTFRPWPRS